MSRSRRRTPIVGNTCAPSDKPYKVDEHRRERRAVRVAVATADDHEAAVLPSGYGNPWKSPKDGKYWVSPRRPEMLRK